jgi:hypothetical protein
LSCAVPCVEVAQHGQPVLLARVREQFAHRRDDLRSQEDRLRILHVGGTVERRSQHLAPAARPAPQRERFICRDGERPGRGIAARVEVGGLLEHLQQRRLGGVLALLGIAKPLADVLPQGRPELVVDHVERIAVAFGQASHAGVQFVAIQGH